MEQEVGAPDLRVEDPETGASTTASVAPAGADQPTEQARPNIVVVEVAVPKPKGERVWLVSSVVLVVVGILVTFGGYWGASGTNALNKQIPFLLSGGMLGLGLVVAGAAVFVRISISRFLRYWMIRDIYERRVQADRVVDSMADVERALREATRPRTQSD